ESIDPDAAFELGQDFLRKGLNSGHFERLISTLLPNGVSAFSRRGVQIAEEWYRAFNFFPNLDAVFNPESGRERLPDKEGAMVVEARLLRDVLYERLPDFDGCHRPELTNPTDMPACLYGLYVLLRTEDRDKALRASQSKATLIRLIGMTNRLENNAD